MIHPERIRHGNDHPTQKGRYVLYWMQAAQRTVCNHALEFAIRQANELGVPVVVVFGLTDRFPEANIRHYTFMLQGLSEVQTALLQRGIPFVVRHESPELAAVELAANACIVVTDVGYLKVQQRWRRYVAQHVNCPYVEVETDVIVPVSVAYDREAYTAAILRRKITPHLKHYLVPLKETSVKKDAAGLSFKGIDVQDIPAVLGKLSLDRSVSPVDMFHGGRQTATRLLDQFIRNNLRYYKDHRNDPSTDYGSHMSPYLHFGQISPLEIALKVRRARGKRRETKDAYLEELIVRRELGMNFVRYNAGYDSFRALPDWARQTLEYHRQDPRSYTYDIRSWEQSRTHDTYWNTAQQEMVVTGKMHNYMRMYWGKKILEWSKTPEDAYQTALYLNNKYELDGRDPNSFAGVAWCFGKHDRPWAERPVFGKVRYMNAAGLRRKFDIDSYVKRIMSLADKKSAPGRNAKTSNR